MEPKRLTDDDLRAIRARDEAYAHAYKIWNSQRNPDSDFYDDTPIPHPSAPEDRAALLAHADALAARVAELEAAQAEDLVRLRIDHSRLQVVLWTLLNELSPGVVEEHARRMVPRHPVGSVRAHRVRPRLVRCAARPARYVARRRPDRRSRSRRLGWP